MHIGNKWDSHVYGGCAGICGRADVFNGSSLFAWLDGRGCVAGLHSGSWLVYLAVAAFLQLHVAIKGAEKKGRPGDNEKHGRAYFPETAAGIPLADYGVEALCFIRRRPGGNIKLMPPGFHDLVLGKIGNAIGDNSAKRAHAEKEESAVEDGKPDLRAVKNGHSAHAVKKNGALDGLRGKIDGSPVAVQKSLLTGFALLLDIFLPESGNGIFHKP